MVQQDSGNVIVREKGLEGLPGFVVVWGFRKL
jgi:hypothetical protein